MIADRRTLMLSALAATVTHRAAYAQGQGPRLFSDSNVVVKDRISVEVVGRGPDVVFIPGSVSSREVWRVPAESLRGRYRLHLVQLAGFGGEPPRANAAGAAWEPTAEAIDSYVAEAKIAPTVLVGHSLGGTMALYLSQRHPDHYRKAMLVDATPYLAETMRMPEGAVAGMRAAIAADRAQLSMSMIEPGIATMVGKPADQQAVLQMARASDPKAAGRLYLENMVMDLRPGLKATKTPITVVFPDSVPNGLPAGSVRPNYEKAFADLPGTAFLEVKDSRHFVMQDQPEAFLKILEAYLAAKP